MSSNQSWVKSCSCWYVKNPSKSKAEVYLSDRKKGKPKVSLHLPTKWHVAHAKTLMQQTWYMWCTSRDTCGEKEASGLCFKISLYNLLSLHNNYHNMHAIKLLCLNLNVLKSLCSSLAARLEQIMLQFGCLEKGG